MTSMSELETKRVLSVQSHVTHGYVGNKVAVFAMQLFEMDVDPIHVVELSNHTGYPNFRGRRASVEDIASIIEGLRLNRFLELYTCVLTGYVGNAEVVRLLSGLVVEVRAIAVRRSPLLFVCDPVLGDNGRLYVPEAVVEAYAAHLVPLADLVTPNGFEASRLAGMDTIHSIDDAARCADWFHERGVGWVVIKSFVVPSAPEESLADGPKEDDWIYFFSSVRRRGQQTDKETNQERSAKLGRVRKIEGNYSGTGDLFAAVLTARMLQHDGTVEASVFHDMVLSSMLTLKLVISSTRGAPPVKPAGIEDETPHFRELCIPRCASHILQPQPSDTDDSFPRWV